MTPDELFRFTQKVIKRPGGCAEWTAGTRNGYGVLRARQNGAWFVEYAHRLAYEHWIGPIPRKLVVHHKCKNRKCINPYHLEVRTRGDNVIKDISKEEIRRRAKLGGETRWKNHVKKVRHQAP